jgi:hypothetical protein
MRNVSFQELGGLEAPILQTRAIVMTLANTAEVEAMNVLLLLAYSFLVSSSASSLFPFCFTLLYATSL